MGERGREGKREGGGKGCVDRRGRREEKKGRARESNVFTERQGLCLSSRSIKKCKQDMGELIEREATPGGGPLPTTVKEQEHKDAAAVSTTAGSRVAQRITQTR